MTELKCDTTHENSLLEDFLFSIFCNLSYFRAQNSFPNKSYRANKTNFAQNFMNFVADAIVFAIVLGVLFLIPHGTDKVVHVFVLVMTLSTPSIKGSQYHRSIQASSCVLVRKIPN